MLIGTERGWSARDIDDTHLPAGIRTFGLAGLLGGLSMLFSNLLGIIAWITLLLVFGVLVVAGYLGDLRNNGDQGMTSEIALLLTFLLGGLALADSRALAAAGAVVVTLLLSLKSVLHSALHKLTTKELSGALKLLFISVVLLPALPNQGYGPWQVFNPYVIWWMVVLIAGIGFAAYVAIRAAGTRYGLLLTSLLGGIVSSTAMTLTLSRLHKEARLQHLLACGLLATSALMFPRVLLEVGVINPALLTTLSWPMAVVTLVYAGGALLYYRRSGQEAAGSTETLLQNPFELRPALRFAALLALILFFVEAARRWLGEAGIYLIALLAGLSDVDAITLSLARNAQGDLANEVAVHGIFLAALSNSLVKGVLIAVVGGSRLAWLTLPVMAAGLLGGLATLLLL
ncbi:MgtC/SapB family protein [Azotobacter armeniacus]